MTSPLNNYIMVMSLHYHNDNNITITLHNYINVCMHIHIPTATAELTKLHHDIIMAFQCYDVIMIS